MKAELKILLLAGLMILPCAPQDAPAGTASPITAFMSNGRRWRTLGDGEKLVWIIAYRDGLIGAFLYSCGKHPEGCGSEALASQMRNMYPEKLSYGEVRSALDHFFETAENRPIPIGEGVTVVVMSAVGVQQSKIDDYVSSLRRTANMDTGK